MGRSYQFVLALLGALVAAPSIISVLQREFSFGLAPAFDGFVAFYRDLIAPVTSVIGSWLQPILNSWGVSLPGWFGDAQVLSLVSAGILNRATGLDIEADEETARSVRNPSSYLTDILFCLFVGLSLLALPLLVLCVFGLVIAPLSMWVRGFRRSGGNWTGAQETEYRLWGEIARRNVRFSILLIQTTVATAAAVIAFYVGSLLSQ